MWIPRAHGGTSTDIWASLDGRANAPAGTPLFSTLLDGYAPGTGRVRTGGTVAAAVASGNYQPPWQVAGVDYPVGINSGTSLVVPNSGNIPAQCSIESYGVAINATCTFNGFNCDGIDVLVWHGSPIITNCSFVGGIFQVRSDTSPLPTGCTVRYCNLDANAADSSGNPGSHCKTAGDGLVTFEYCIIDNAWAVNFQISGQGTGNSYVIRYNVIGSAGLGHPVDASHGDWIQLDGGLWQSVICDFNTIVSNYSIATESTQGFSFNSESGTGTINSGSCSNNTGVTFKKSGNVTVGQFLLMDQQFLATPYAVTNNYVDLTGIDPAHGFFQEGGATGPFPSGTAVLTQNVNMLTGATLS